ncbi:hypothetical protein H1Z61_12445 [Bacillus aquiflavi]|uniref:Uncharacterized protein n=1 Tax=Bacillus aquiflavi TaxID=2672567 RepID=A0A7W2AFS9_9BACI|nr:hypothetical protein [Bacillus aquiflavi]MBA4537918.1 hypothetical protein [Bacillus aquiflavi]UAC50161.1 hypothetical protein K6959_05100 [Bacillus aquiflavi]
MTLIKTSRKQVLQKEKMAILKLEMDYELATLFEAMEENNEEQKQKCIRRLEKIREELLRLKAL